MASCRIFVSESMRALRDAARLGLGLGHGEIGEADEEGAVVLRAEEIEGLELLLDFFGRDVARTHGEGRPVVAQFAPEAGERHQLQRARHQRRDRGLPALRHAPQLGVEGASGSVFRRSPASSSMPPCASDAGGAGERVQKGTKDDAEARPHNCTLRLIAEKEPVMAPRSHSIHTGSALYFRLFVSVGLREPVRMRWLEVD